MGIAVDVLRTAVNTTTGNQTFTGSVGGLTPKAALFFITKATTDGTAADGWAYGYGAATGTSNRWYVSAGSAHNLTTSEANTIRSTGGCIALLDETTASTADCIADFVSFGANSVTINWTTAPSAAYLMTVVLFAGSDLSAQAAAFNLGNATGVQDNTGVGFEPDAVFCVSQQYNDAARATNMPSFGLVANDGVGGVTQRVGHFLDRDAKTSTAAAAHASATYGAWGLNVAAAVDWLGSFQDFDSSGFSVNVTTSGANSYDLYYLALAFAGAVGHKIITYTTPTSTGSDANTAVGFKPQAVIGIANKVDAEDSVQNSGDTISSHGMFFWDASEQYCNTGASEDSVSTTNTQSLSDNQAVNVPDDNGAAGLTASLTTFDTNGFTLNWTAVETTARYFYLLAIEEEVVGGVTVTPSPASAVAGIVAPTVVLGSQTIAPAAITAIGAVVDPTVVLGSVSVAPTAVSAIGVTIDPTVVLGSVSVAPAAINAIGSTVDPTVILGSVAIAPTAITAIGTTVDPTVVIGSPPITPTPAAAISTTVNPTVVLGSTSVTPSPVVAIGTIIDPTVFYGSTTATPSPVSAIGRKVDPTVVLGNITIIPDPAEALGSTTDPTVILGDLSITPSPVSAIGETVDPTVIEGGDVILTPDPASAPASTIDPTVVLGSVSITPSPVYAIGTTIDPTVLVGDVVVAPDPAEAIGATIDPTVVLGSVSITPAAIGAIGATIDPTVFLSGTVATPSPAAAIGATIDPTVVLGSLTLAPSPAAAIAGTIDPTVILGSIAITPAPAESVADMVDPTLILGSTTVTPSPAAAIGAVVNPSILLVSPLAIDMAIEVTAGYELTLSTSRLYALELSDRARYELAISGSTN